MIDAIGYPIQVGVPVLVSGYSSSSLNTIATVDKVNKSSVTVTLKVGRYDYPTKKYVTEYKKMRRTSSQLVVINHQLAYIQEHFPENLL